MFPLGNITKAQVRTKAKQLGLPNAERKDSQGVCFVGKVEIGECLRDYIAPKKGKIVDTNGKVLGEHDGAFYYATGQRKGIKLAGGPYYVVSTDIKKNTVTVSTNEKDIEGKEVRVSNINWLSSDKEVPSEVMVKLRYRQKNAEAEIEKEGDSYVFRFKDAQRAITPGQFAVLYTKQDEMLGGGVIE